MVYIISINICFFLMVIYLFCLFFLLVLVYCKLSISILDWDFLSVKFDFSFLNVMFSFVLFLVVVSVIIYSSYYMNGDLNLSYYCLMLALFIVSMFCLLFSNGVFIIMMSWDLLGVSSFFLVLYFMNWESCSGAMSTVMISRLGDYFLFLFFSGVMLSGCYFLSLEFFCYLLGVFVLMAAFTKSAQYPFSSWLPKAMSAPTPVSSLVHSSTLVTAGLVLLSKFSFLIFSVMLSKLIMLFGLVTMFFSSIMAALEMDLKKVVALSTLSQIGFSMLTLGMGLEFVSYLHLLSHALFKSCLFMQVGYIIHCNLGQQDMRFYSGNFVVSCIMQLSLLVTIFCLCGMMFFSGAVSKDYILKYFFFNNYLFCLVVVFFVSVFLTFVYSCRLLNSMFLLNSKSVLFYDSSYLAKFSSLLLVFFSIVYMWWVSNNLVVVPDTFLYLDSLLPLMFMFMLLLLYGLFFNYGFLLFKNNFLLEYLYKVSYYWFINFKFNDMFLITALHQLVSCLKLISLLSLSYLMSVIYNSVVLIPFFLMML